MIISDSQDFIQRKDVKLNYILTTPSNYEYSESLPLIVFLHGAGEKGDNIEAVKTHGIPKYFSADQDYKGIRAITLSPQCPEKLTWIDLKNEVVSLINIICNKYSIDRTRVSLCGISMGGFGTWEIGISFPEMFSALAPICGGGMNWRCAALKNIPIWAFHGELDDVVPVTCSVNMVESTNQCGGNAKLTVYEGIYHNCWEKAFEDTNLISWLVSAQKK